jgi:hypothetical protein
MLFYGKTRERHHKQHNGRYFLEDSHSKIVSAVRLMKDNRELPEQLLEMNTVYSEGSMYVKWATEDYLRTDLRKEIMKEIWKYVVWPISGIEKPNVFYSWLLQKMETKRRPSSEMYAIQCLVSSAFKTVFIHDLNMFLHYIQETYSTVLF